MRKSRLVQFMLICLVCVSANGFAIDVPVTWDDGASTHNWTDGPNWNPDTTGGPGNVGTLEFFVTIPAGYNPIYFDPTLPVEVTEFLLGDNANLILNSDTDLTILETASIAGIISGEGGDFTAISNSATLTGNRARVYASNGSRIEIAGTDYDARGLPVHRNPSPVQPTYNFTLFQATGSGTQLLLPLVQNIDVGASGSYCANHHFINVADGGFLNLSSVKSVRSPVWGGDYLTFSIDGASSLLDMSSLEQVTTAGSSPVYFNVTNGGHLIIGGADINASTAITLSSPLDHLEIANAITLDNFTTVNTSSGGIVTLNGDFNFTYTNTAKLDLELVRVEAIGTVQELEVGGTDYDLQLQFLPEKNFDIGQLIVGQCDQPTLLHLVDNLDNLQPGVPDALYLVGLDGDPNAPGLRIMGGSVLMIGDLNVYAMKDGAIERVRDWFGPGETIIAYDEGYIMLGNPDINNSHNLILNGGFETGVNPPDAGTLFATLGAGVTDIDNWTIGGDGIDWCHDTLFTDADDAGVLSVDLSGTPEGCGVISQDIATQIGHRYFVWFDMSYNPVGNAYGQAGEKTIEVRAAGDSKQFTIDSTVNPAQWPADPNLGWTVPWQTMTYSFVAKDATTTLEFACMDNPATAFGAAIDNVVVIEGGKLLSLIQADLSGNGVVNLEDLSIFCVHWLFQDCNPFEGCWCGGADLDKDGDVDMQDFAILAGNWLEGQTEMYGLTISSTAGGSVVDPGEGNFYWQSERLVPVVAEADTHYIFTGWTGTAVDNDKVAASALSATEVNVDGVYTLQANFEKKTYTLTISSTSGGSVSEPGEGLFTYEAETNVDITAVAESHQHFVEWIGTAVDAGKVAHSSSPSTTVLMDSNYTLEAVFESDELSLTISSGVGGNVTQPGEGLFSYPYGTNLTVQATADTHYTFTAWTGTAVDAGKVANTTSVQTTVMVDANYTLVANFERKQYSVTISSNDGGSVTVPGEGVFTYDSEEQVTLTAVAEAQYHFAYWSGPAVTDGMVNNPTSTTTTLTVNGNTSLSAVFERDLLALTIDSSEGGNVTVPGEGVFNYPYGDIVSLTASVDSGYQFVQWTGTAVTAGKVANRFEPQTSVTVDGAYTLTAEFELKPIQTVYNFTLDSNPGWTMEGQWAYGIPMGQGGVYFGYPDPTSGYTGTAVIGVNLNGDYALDIGGPYALTAGPFDMSNYQDITIKFASWLNTDFPEYVKHALEVSVDGSNWTTVWQHTERTVITDSQWSIREYALGTIADGKSTVYLRWVYQIVAERSYPYSGWNFDDIQLIGREK